MLWFAIASGKKQVPHDQLAIRVVLLALVIDQIKRPFDLHWPANTLKQQPTQAFQCPSIAAVQGFFQQTPSFGGIPRNETALPGAAHFAQGKQGERIV